MSLPESLERAATELMPLAEKIRPANGDPHRLLDELDPGEAGELVAWILENESDAAPELVEAWSENDVGSRVLLTVPDEGLAKPSRKLLRRVRHRLRSQGVEVNEPAPTTVRKKIAGAERFEEAHLSAPDFRGTRMAYLAEPHPTGGARLFEIRLDEGRGILDFKVYNAGRSKVRGFLRSLTRGQSQRLFDVERTALRALVRRASLAQPADRPLPTAFVEWRGRLFGEEVEQQPTPGAQIRARLAGNEGDAEEALEAVVGEIGLGMIGPWPPPTQWVGDRMEQGRTAVDGLDGEARASAVDAWIEEATGALEEASDMDLLARHLDELAWIRSESGDEDGARRLIAASGAAASDPGAAQKLTRARVEALFGPFLTELRVVEEKIGADTSTGSGDAAESAPETQED